MKIAKFPIIIILLSFCIGIVIDNYLPINHSISLLLSGLSVLGLFASNYFAGKNLLQRNYFGFFGIATLIALGITTHSLHTEKHYQNHYSKFNTEGRNTISGTISERLKPNAYAEKYYFKIEKLNNKNAFGKVLLNVSKKEITEEFKAGTNLLIYQELQPIKKNLNPFQFDYAAYLDKQQVSHQLYLNQNEYKITGTRQNFDYYVGWFQDELLSSFQIHGFSETTQGIINALLLGQRQDMDPEVNKHYTDAGVIHILAISGLHIAILYALLLTLLKPLNRLKSGKLYQLLIAILFLWSFAILSGLSGSVVRSVVMFSFMSFGLYLNKSPNMYNIMAMSMLFILLFKPNFLFDVGFQLSYAAVFSIVALQPLFRKYRFKNSRIGNYCLDLVLISLIAQIGVLPISLYYFHQFPSLFLLANIVVIPLSSFILVYGIFILLLNFVAPQIAIVLGKLLSFSIELMNRYISWVASFETFTFKEIPFTTPLLLSLYVTIILGTLYFYEKKFNRLMGTICCLVLFQLAILLTTYNQNTLDEFVVFNTKKATMLLIKQKDSAIVYSNNSETRNASLLKAYRQERFLKDVKMDSVKNTLVFNEKKILILDSLGIYNVKQQPEVVVLTQSPKVNLKRLITAIHPKQIIADASNYKSYVKRWKATCEKEKIPFHTTAEKGFYRIN
ncbi:ComEC/Rec2 family competence protein [Flavobacterium sp.]|uniref:ComEC/Rec2 family competence protein n=1 Tax=Flavobacterium sp. TaxID=239 RepID=UPI0028BE25EA|nr:ComEC/Rec2 family competence protein [Flavobacterium sp.]